MQTGRETSSKIENFGATPPSYHHQDPAFESTVHESSEEEQLLFLRQLVHVNNQKHAEEKAALETRISELESFNKGLLAKVKTFKDHTRAYVKQIQEL